MHKLHLAVQENEPLSVLFLKVDEIKTETLDFRSVQHNY
jgi:hypothetical protein